MSRRSRRTAAFFTVATAFILASLVEKSIVSVASMTLGEVEEKLQDLNAEKIATSHQTSSLTSRIFSILFPGSPAVNALLATLYISGPPNFLLALCPPNIDPSTLSVMVAFAVGGLLGDTFFHLLPEIFLGEPAPDRVRFVLVEHDRNLLLGVAIMVGFVTFTAMDKGIRIATGGGGHDHAHTHSHARPEKESLSVTASGAETSSGSVRSRKGKDDKAGSATGAVPEKEARSGIKMAGLLNLIADFTHNITDGLAMSSSFYASPIVGATTTMAVFFHEIPHEVGDFALLVQSGFSKRAAMGAQFITALGALLGTLIGIAVQEYGGGGDGTATGPGLAGTSLSWGDLLLPFTAGTFLYVATVSVIPELLETAPGRWSEQLRKTVIEFAAMAAGAAIMLFISCD